MKHTLTIEGTADEVREALDKLTGRTETVKQVKTPSPDTTVALDEITLTKANDDPDEVVVDADGMPYSADYHTAKRTMTEDGLWKARRGKAVEANRARDVFKAGGADVEAPVIEDEIEKSDDAPLLPGADAIPDPEPVTMAQFTAKATSALSAGKVDNAGIVALYLEVTGQPDAKSAAQMLQSNESMRRAIVDRLTELEEG